MKIVLDTNVVIDAVASRQPFCVDAEKILLMASEEKIVGYLTANSITDIFYVVRRILPEAETRDIIRSLLYSLDVIEVGEADSGMP
jgi:predicted nucleic acid-binding protein